MFAYRFEKRRNYVHFAFVNGPGWGREKGREREKKKGGVSAYKSKRVQQPGSVHELLVIRAYQREFQGGGEWMQKQLLPARKKREREREDHGSRTKLM